MGRSPHHHAARRISLSVKTMSFEANLTRLEQIVSQLDGDRLDLNASLKLFEEGIELLRKASLELNETESKVKELVERADGVLELRDFGD
ncbi:MAG TPA: exodeoxyribonuclease VII small subunit [Gemmatimonadaceae bacterium]|nr:exodeoxyribonuclease VII small subunit [Gemmatimonadaceae bacterium]